MPIKFTKRVPPPQPVPPPTFGLVGLSREEADLLKRAISFARNNHTTLYIREKEGLDRMIAVLGGTPQEEAK